VDCTVPAMEQQCAVIEVEVEAAALQAKLNSLFFLSRTKEQQPPLPPSLPSSTQLNSKQQQP
jgi:hypothetical protein